MCQSKSEGGERCKGTPFGSSVYALYKERKASSTDADRNALTDKIDKLRYAKSLYGTCVSPYHLELPKGVDDVLDSARKVGNPLIVGGAVRDSLMGAENKDIDIEVHGTTIDELSKALRQDGYSVDEVGKQFGVLKISKRGGVRDIDVSVPRRENNVGAGHRSFEVKMDEAMTVEDAASRRDFTFNAISYDASNKALVDPYNGVEDFENNTLRHVSPAFSEDPLRVLRAFQFAGRFNLDIHPDTAQLCSSLRGEYSTLSHERVTEEWGKFYEKSSHPSKGVEVLQASGWDDTIPHMKEALAKDETKSALDKLPAQPKDERVVLGSAVIAANMNPLYRGDLIKTTVLGSKPQKLAYTLADFSPSKVTNSYEAKVVARDLHNRGFNFALYERYATMRDDKDALATCAVAKKAGVFNGPEQPMVMGRDVISLTSQKPGPWVKGLLDEVEDRQLRGEFASKDEAMEFAKSLVPRG